MTDTNDTRDAGLDVDAELSTAKEFEISHALIVGIDAYQHRIPNLKTAVNDAIALARSLEDVHRYQVKTLTNHQATRSTLLTQLDPNQIGSWASQIGLDDRVIFYFAGHGLAEQGDDGPAGYLLPQDANRGPENNVADASTRGVQLVPLLDQAEDSQTEQTPPDAVDVLEQENNFLAMGRLHKLLTSLPCRHMLIILDCCFAGAMRWATTRAVHVPPKTIHLQRYQHYIQSPAWQLLTSAAYDQKALDVMQGRMYARTRPTTAGNHSPFALALIEALSRDVADTFPPPTNGQPAGDGLLTIYELYQYLEETVWQGAAEVEHVQTPELWPLKKHRNGQFVFDIPGKMLNLPRAEDLTVDHNPYRGLESFEANDYHLFFGRQQAVEDLVQQVHNERLTVVLGASGTGKSSLVKAGLLPVLKGAVSLRPNEARQSLNVAHSDKLLSVDPDRWCVLPPLRPTANPIEQLVEHLAKELNRPHLNLQANRPAVLANFLKDWSHENPDRRLLLTIDQFEELVTVCGEPARLAFLELLAEALRVDSGCFHLVITLRTDFEPQLAHLALKPYWEAGRFIVQPMSRRELQEAIEGPASERILYFEPPELVERLINEVIDTPGALPLLSFALKQMYLNYIKRNSDQRAISEEDYRALGGDEALGGGVIGALRHTANREYEALNETEQATMQRMMLRMISTEGGELTRRKVPLAELVYSDPDENKRIEKILNRLTDKDVRLLVSGALKRPDGSDEPYVEPAHDALVRAWDKLQRWTQQNAADLPLQRELNQQAIKWSTEPDQENKRNLLWPNDPRLPRLEQIVTGEAPAATQNLFTRLIRNIATLWENSELSPINNHWLNKLELDFVWTSVLRRRQDARRLVGTVITVFLVLIGLVVFALVQQSIASEQRTNAINAASTAEAQRLAAERQTRLSRSRELAARSLEIFEPDPQLGLLLAREAIKATYDTDGDYTSEAEAALYQLLSTPFQGIIRMPGQRIVNLAISPNNSRIVTSSYDWYSLDHEDKDINLWRINGTLIGSLGKGKFAIFSLVDSTLIVVRQDGKISVWDYNGQLISEFSPSIRAIKQVAWSNLNGSLLIAGCQTAPLDSSSCLTPGLEAYNVAEGNLQNDFDQPSSLITHLKFHAPSSKVLAVTDDQRLNIWNLRGEKLSEYVTNLNRIEDLIVNAAGTEIMLIGSDSAQILRPDGSLVGTIEEVIDFAAFTEDANDEKLITIQRYPSKISHRTLSGIWEWSRLLTGSTLALSDQGDQILTADCIAWTSSGKACTSSDAQVQSVVGLTPSAWLRGQKGYIETGYLSPDSTLVATAGNDGNIWIWSLANNHLKTFYEVIKFTNLKEDELPQIVLIGEQSIKFLDDKGIELGAVDIPGGLQRNWGDIDLSSDGRHFVTTGAAGQVLVISRQEGTVEFETHIPEAQLNFAKFIPSSGKLLIGGCLRTPEGQCSDGTLQIWDWTEDKLIKLIEGFNAPVIDVQFSADSSRILVIQDGGPVLLFADLEKNRLAELEIKGEENIYPDRFKFNSEENYIIDSGHNSVFRMWDQNGKLLLENTEWSGAILSPDNRVVMLVDSCDARDESGFCTSGGLEIYSISGEFLTRIGGLPGGVISTQFSPDGKRILVTDGSANLQLWTSDGLNLAVYPINSIEESNSARFSSNGSRIITQSEDFSFSLWKVWDDINVMMDEAQHRAGRSLVPSECQQYLQQPDCS